MEHHTWFLFYRLNRVLGKQHLAPKFVEIKIVGGWENMASRGREV